MRLLRLIAHVTLAGVYVFLTSLTVLMQLLSGGSWLGLFALLVVGGWAGASATLRTRGSLVFAGLAISGLFVLAKSSWCFATFVAFWVLLALVPLSLLLWVLVAWRHGVDDLTLEAQPAV
ncbi:MAG: hypothetical protein ACOZQL_41875 [Myxococcota bacterium]